MSVASFFLENSASQLHPKSSSMLNQRSGTQTQPFPIQIMEVKRVEKRSHISRVGKGAG